MDAAQKALQEIDENERTNETGLYHYAVSYNGVADYLAKARSLNVTHPEEPREYLYAHAIELYFKAFLRNCGWTVSELRKIGHNLKELQKVYELRGGVISAQDKSVIALLAANNAKHELRYIKTGYCQKYPIDLVSLAAANLRETVGQALRATGRVVRWYQSAE